MRILSLILSALIATPLAAQDLPAFDPATAPEQPVSATCEYRHPAHPGWDFYQPCVIRPEAAIWRVEVRNGSKFTVDPASGAVNGLAADEIEAEAGKCFRTRADQERICLYAPGAAAPTPAATPRALPQGGKRGHCLMVIEGALADHGPCARTASCVKNTKGENECITQVVWASGREDGIYSAPGWHALNGAAAEEKDGCVTSEDSGEMLCFADAPWSEEALAQYAATPETGAPTPEQSATCVLLKAGRALRQGPCRVIQTCTDPGCPTRYAMEGGHVFDLSDGPEPTINGLQTAPIALGPRRCYPYGPTDITFCAEKR
ncbi:MAG: hypothetical protein CR993_06935 [Rhodobacterales bacterium]|nr:MAG: hypothetical protein CR993_06935 [Rhodobacterales bacterium]